MDTPSRVEELLARAVEEQVDQQRSWRDAMDRLADRVAVLESSVERLRSDLEERPDPASAIADAAARLEGRLEDLAAAVQSAPREAIAGELEQVTGELSRRVSELGRMIVRDLGRLQQVLESHRAAIVQEIRPWLVASATTPAAPSRLAPLATPSIEEELAEVERAVDQEQEQQPEPEPELGEPDLGQPDLGEPEVRRRRRFRQ